MASSSSNRTAASAQSPGSNLASGSSGVPDSQPISPAVIPHDAHRASPKGARGYPGRESLGKPVQGWRLTLYSVIFEADTVAGRRFDLTLIALILCSLVVIMFDSVEAYSTRYGVLLHTLEWAFTLIFTVEYVLRLVCVRHPVRYATSFFGIIDLLAIVPTYAAFFFPEFALLIGVRALRLLRIFRVLRLTLFISEYVMLGRALKASARKIFVFLSAVLMVVLVMGTIMYVVEGPENGFLNIPVAVYWAITTMATVGFGDIVPHTGLGRFIASLMMLLGWGVLAVPTGIVTMEMTIAQRSMAHLVPTRTCRECLTEGHEIDAKFCKQCGAALLDRENGV